tara:strand:- start:1543 stop:1707 length:165 start_codon:yes stop_codon:yes gene_type:complete
MIKVQDDVWVSPIYIKKVAKDHEGKWFIYVVEDVLLEVEEDVAISVIKLISGEK